MFIPCRKAASIPGLLVEALSGEVVRDLQHINPICDLRDRTDIKHIVAIKNFRVYPLSVRCVGRIHGDPNNIKFAAQDPGVSETHWEKHVSRVTLAHAFSHVSLLGKTPGDNEVEASVTVYWPEPNKQETIAVSIRVTA